MKSKILMVIAFACVLASAIYMYNRYVIEHNFDIYQNEDGIPEILEE
ncbi:MAG: hypothetical protein Q8L64_04720 [bacterium]|nr:hypothetical protein [bacterium]